MSPVIFNASNVGLVERLRPLPALVPQDGIATATPGQVVYAATVRAWSAIPSAVVIPGLAPALHTAFVRAWSPATTIAIEHAVPLLEKMDALLAEGTVQISPGAAQRNFYSDAAPVLFYDTVGADRSTQVAAVKRFAPSLKPLIPVAEFSDVDDAEVLLADVELLAATAVTLGNRTFLAQLFTDDETALRRILYARTLGNTMIGLSEVLTALEALAAVVSPKQAPEVTLSPEDIERESWLNRPITDLDLTVRPRHWSIDAELHRIGDLYLLFCDGGPFYTPAGEPLLKVILKTLKDRYARQIGWKSAREINDVLIKTCNMRLGTKVVKDGDRYRLVR